MQKYLLSVVGVSFAAALTRLLSPRGERDGLIKAIRLLTAILVIFVLIAPLRSVVGGIADWFGTLSTDGVIDDLRESAEAGRDDLTRAYLTERLTRRLEEDFGIAEGDLTCFAEWEDGETLRPLRVTLLLSGGAIWKDARAMEEEVTTLLGCPCESVIE